MDAKGSTKHVLESFIILFIEKVRVFDLVSHAWSKNKAALTNIVGSNQNQTTGLH